MQRSFLEYEMHYLLLILVGLAIIGFISGGPERAFEIYLKIIGWIVRILILLILVGVIAYCQSV